LAPDMTQHVVDIPRGPLGIVGMAGCTDFAQKVDAYIAGWRKDRHNDLAGEFEFTGYHRPSYLIDFDCPRFGTGEGKGSLNQSVRGDDIYIIIDCFNYSVTYDMYGMKVPMGPDEHYSDLKRVIGAIGKKARRINVIMPMLYEGRQHKRSRRESLDCSMMLQELYNLGVDNFITFDAHDPRVNNAVPMLSFENFYPTYQFLKAMFKAEPDLDVSKEKLMIISPDEGAMNRCVYYSSVLNVDMGVFYKRRDYSRVVNGRNPIVAHDFLGDSVEGRDLIVVDDMIATGESTLDIAYRLKKRGAGKIFICATFGLFSAGLDAYDQAYKEGYIDHVFTTNLIYQRPELLERPWYCSVDLTKYVALIIDSLNHDGSLSELIEPAGRINNLLAKYRNK